VYAPALIVEVLSPSNTSAKISRQRIVALSAGTQEFWVVDPERRTVLVTNLSGTNVYTLGDDIPLPMFGATVFEK
jgi:Uma2 family endonuclease